MEKKITYSDMVEAAEKYYGWDKRVMETLRSVYVAAQTEYVSKLAERVCGKKEGDAE